MSAEQFQMSPVTKRTRIVAYFSNGQMLETYLDAEGMTFEQEAAQVANVGLECMRIALSAPKIGERADPISTELEEPFSTAA